MKFHFGLELGAVVGFSSGNDNSLILFSYTAAEKGLALRALGFGVGAVVEGIMVVATHRALLISGNRQQFIEMYQEFCARYHSDQRLTTN